MNPKELKYSKDHEWVKIEGNDSALIGITEFATDSLGDVVFIPTAPAGLITIRYAALSTS